jgi:hypothetical protein
MRPSTNRIATVIAMAACACALLLAAALPAGVRAQTPGASVQDSVAGQSRDTMQTGVGGVSATADSAQARSPTSLRDTRNDIDTPLASRLISIVGMLTLLAVSQCRPLRPGDRRRWRIAS